MDKATLLAYLKADSKSSYDMQYRRHDQWNENYLLYRDKVEVNRLTQRQAVNVPIIRETVQAWISKIDEPPLLVFEARGKDNADKRAEIIMNEVYSYYYDKLHLDQVDTLEKKVVGLQGRVFKKFGFSKAKNMAWVAVCDPFDIEVDPKANMFQLDETANFLNHKNIYVYLKDILADPLYDEEEKNKLKVYLDSSVGILTVQDTVDAHQAREARLRTLGAFNFDAMGAKDVLVELKEHYKKLWVESEKKFVWHLIINAADVAILYQKTLKEAIGVDFLPFTTWADDPDVNDPWPDGKADSVRTFNKIANIYVSQMLENRTYRNFGMYFYDNTNEDFKPVAMDPRPFGFFGVPGNPTEVMKQIDIPELTGTMEELNWLKDTIQSSVAITPTERGINDRGANKTLGAKEINLEQSTKVTTVTQKNYRASWKEFGWKFYELLKANTTGKLTLYKKGADDQYYPKTVYPRDWDTKAGFNIKVIFKSDKESEDNQMMQKATFVMNNFEGNMAAIKIAKRKQLESLGWKPEEIQQVMDFEDQQAASADAAATAQGLNPAGPGSGIDENVMPINKAALSKELTPQM